MKANGPALALGMVFWYPTTCRVLRMGLKVIIANGKLKLGPQTANKSLIFHYHLH